eukprot:SAG25_NODE_618_length_6422_cov_3.817894_6_plen_48_part_00
MPTSLEDDQGGKPRDSVDEIELPRSQDDDELGEHLICDIHHETKGLV